MRRIIICGLHRFPRGGAYANYIQYLCDALSLAGYNTIMLSDINTEFFSEDDFVYHETHVMSIFYHGNKIIQRLMNGKLFSMNLRKKLYSLHLSTSDLVVFPSVSPIAYTVYSIKKQLKFKTAGTPLEWFGKEQYESQKEAIEGERLFRLNEKHELLFPISTNIAMQFPQVKSLVLPIMADVREYEYHPKNYGAPFMFVIPANGMMKDALDNMLLGLIGLDDAEIDKIQVHLTGVKEETVKSILGDKWEKIKTKIIIHKWMKYDELIDLYKKCHYLFLAREKNQMTESNFPSKVPEVMTYGIVPLCSRVGDYTQFYLTDNKDSLIFDGCEIEDCTDALRRAINISPSEFFSLSNSARRCAEEKFDYHNWYSRIRDSIEDVFEEN